MSHIELFLPLEATLSSPHLWNSRLETSRTDDLITGPHPFSSRTTLSSPHPECDRLTTSTLGSHLARYPLCPTLQSFQKTGKTLLKSRALLPLNRQVRHEAGMTLGGRRCEHAAAAVPVQNSVVERRVIGTNIQAMTQRPPMRKHKIHTYKPVSSIHA